MAEKESALSQMIAVLQKFFERHEDVDPETAVQRCCTVFSAAESTEGNESYVEEAAVLLAKFYRKSTNYGRTLVITALRREKWLYRLFVAKQFRSLTDVWFPRNITFADNGDSAHLPYYLHAEHRFLMSFGTNRYFNLGIVSDGNPVIEPKMIKMSSVAKIAMSDQHTVFLTDNGEVYACGNAIAARVYDEEKDQKGFIAEPGLVHLPKAQENAMQPVSNEIILDIAVATNRTLIVTDQSLYEFGKDLKLESCPRAKRVAANCVRVSLALDQARFVVATETVTFLCDSKLMCTFYFDSEERTRQTCTQAVESILSEKVRKSGGTLSVGYHRECFLKLARTSVLIDNKDSVQILLALQGKTLKWGSIDREQVLHEPVHIAVSGFLLREETAVSDFFVGNNGDIWILLSSGYIVFGRLRAVRTPSDGFKFRKGDLTKLGSAAIIAVVDELPGSHGASYLAVSPDFCNKIYQIGMVKEDMMVSMFDEETQTGTYRMMNVYAELEDRYNDRMQEFATDGAQFGRHMLNCLDDIGNNLELQVRRFQRVDNENAADIDVRLRLIGKAMSRLEFLSYLLDIDDDGRIRALVERSDAPSADTAEDIARERINAYEDDFEKMEQLRSVDVRGRPELGHEFFEGIDHIMMRRGYRLRIEMARRFMNDNQLRQIDDDHVMQMVSSTPMFFIRCKQRGDELLQKLKPDIMELVLNTEDLTDVDLIILVRLRQYARMIAQLIMQLCESAECILKDNVERDRRIKAKRWPMPFWSVFRTCNVEDIYKQRLKECDIDPSNFALDVEIINHSYSEDSLISMRTFTNQRLLELSFPYCARSVERGVLRLPQMSMNVAHNFGTFETIQLLLCDYLTHRSHRNIRLQDDQVPSLNTSLSSLNLQLVRTSYIPPKSLYHLRSTRNIGSFSPKTASADECVVLQTPDTKIRCLTNLLQLYAPYFNGMMRCKGVFDTSFPTGSTDQEERDSDIVVDHHETYFITRALVGLCDPNLLYDHHISDLVEIIEVYNYWISEPTILDTLDIIFAKANDLTIRQVFKLFHNESIANEIVQRLQKHLHLIVMAHNVEYSHNILARVLERRRNPASNFHVLERWKLFTADSVISALFDGRLPSNKSCIHKRFQTAFGSPLLDDYAARTSGSTAPTAANAEKEKKVEDRPNASANTTTSQRRRSPSPRASDFFTIGSRLRSRYRSPFDPPVRPPPRPGWAELMEKTTANSSSSTTYVPFDTVPPEFLPAEQPLPTTSSPTLSSPDEVVKKTQKGGRFAPKGAKFSPADDLLKTPQSSNIWTDRRRRFSSTSSNFGSPPTSTASPAISEKRTAIGMRERTVSQSTPVSQSAPAVPVDFSKIMAEQQKQYNDRGKNKKARSLVHIEMEDLAVQQIEQAVRREHNSDVVVKVSLVQPASEDKEDDEEPQWGSMPGLLKR